MAEDLGGWTAEARVALIDTARRYHSTITYGELATGIQERTGVYTKQLLQNWIGEPLARVTAQCAQLHEPLLSALCVSKSDGTVGKGYAEAVQATYGYKPADPEMHAAEERLKCYRYFEAPDLPQDGGVPALTRQVAHDRLKREEQDRTQRHERDLGKKCPKCHQVPSITGVCGCDY
jgi:hypothetical protein